MLRRLFTGSWDKPESANVGNWPVRFVYFAKSSVSQLIRKPTFVSGVIPSNFINS